MSGKSWWEVLLYTVTQKPGWWRLYPSWSYTIYNSWPWGLLKRERKGPKGTPILHFFGLNLYHFYSWLICLNRSYGYNPIEKDTGGWERQRCLWNDWCALSLSLEATLAECSCEKTGHWTRLSHRKVSGSHLFSSTNIPSSFSQNVLLL
jgi:hypothetical protein